MPRTKPTILTVPQSPSIGPNSAGSEHTLDRFSSGAGPSSDDGSLDTPEPSTFSAPQSPASPRQSSRSFWPSRAARQVKTRIQEEAQGRLTSTSPSTSTLQTPQTSQRPITPSSSHSTEQSFGTSSLPAAGNEWVAVSSLTSHGAEDMEYAVGPPREQSDPASQRRPSKHVFSQFVGRSRSSVRPEVNNRYSIRPVPKQNLNAVLASGEHSDSPRVPHTAPLEAERGYREMFTNANRERSADRVTQRSKGIGETSFKPGSASESVGLSTISRPSAAKVPDSNTKVSKGFLSRFTRTGSAPDPRDMVDESHVINVINQPLEAQTRLTRIKPRIDQALDKTEFWLPSLPYRSIEYLNEKASEEEGLYRIPGSGRDIRYWQVRFDTERDVNLLLEPSLYDPNIIGSMLKSWLRDLPSPLFPKETQSRLALEYAGARTTPQAMRDELSMLPPYNYYLLFAITCHIAILLSKSDKNKMSYHNLCVCFQPCIGIEGFCFYFLVCDWTNCWQGCWTEKEYYEREEQMASRSEGVPGTASSSGYASSFVDGNARSASSMSRPATDANEASTQLSLPERNERRRPSGVAVTLRPRAGERGRSTPPNIEPVPILSPMRLPVGE